MFEGGLFEVLHTLVGSLEAPVIAALFALLALTLWEVGMAVGETAGGARRFARDAEPGEVEALAQRRVVRADAIARVGPMLGLMGTLIPLGPGLAGLGQGDLQTLASAVITAFDTTVVGLLIGILGYLVGRVRRGCYERLLDELEAAHG